VVCVGRKDLFRLDSSSLLKNKGQRVKGVVRLYHLALQGSGSSCVLGDSSTYYKPLSFDRRHHVSCLQAGNVVTNLGCTC